MDDGRSKRPTGDSNPQGQRGPAIFKSFWKSNRSKENMFSLVHLGSKVQKGACRLMILHGFGKFWYPLLVIYCLSCSAQAPGPRFQAWGTSAGQAGHGGSGTPVRGGRFALGGKKGFFLSLSLYLSLLGHV